MKYLFIGTGLIAAVAFVVLTWGPLGKAPAPAQPSGVAIQQPMPSASEPPPPMPGPPPIPEPASYAQQAPPRLEMPGTPTGARQGSTEPAEPTPARRRPHRMFNDQAAQVNRPVANGFTAELNRQEVQSLQSGGSTPHAPWRELSPPK
jgi:hypothetical protein